MGKKLSASILALLVCASLCPASAQRRGRRPVPRGAATRTSDFNRQTDARVARLGDEYLRGYYAFNPSEATAAGLHEFDPKLEERDEAAGAREVKRLRGVLADLARVPEWRLSPEAHYDYLIVGSHAHAQLLELEDVRAW